MKKHFIKVTSISKTKTKLQEAILENLKELDCTLAGNQSTAFKLIEIAYNDAVNNYEGLTNKQDLQRNQSTPTTAVFWIDQLIQLSIYEVQNDLTLVPDHELKVQKFYERTNP